MSRPLRLLPTTLRQVVTGRLQAMATEVGRYVREAEDVDDWELAVGLAGQVSNLVKFIRELEKRS